MRGSASGTSFLTTIDLTQTTTAEQSTDWYGTVRGRAGWLATPNLLLFGTGGFAYGRVSDSANWALVSAPFNFPFDLSLASASVQCVASGVPCFVGSSSEIRTGWTAGGGIEWLFDRHWSAKIEYQFVDLGTETVRITAPIAPFAACCGQGPASFNAAFHDRFNIVRVGLNYRLW